MKKASDNTALRAFAIGLLAGTRSTLATTIATHYLSTRSAKTFSNSRLGFIEAPAAPVVTKILTAAELVADKLPNAPDRTIPLSVVARVASGAFAGAIVSKAGGDSVAKGLVLGGLAGLASTYLFYNLRKKLSYSGVLKEPWAGVVEDALALGSGVLLVK